MTISGYRFNNPAEDEARLKSQDKDLDYYKKLYAVTDDMQAKTDERDFGNTKRLMENANFFRTKEGGTPGQRDEQTFRRQESSLTNQRFMQQKGADLTDWQRNQDYNRASRAIGDMRNTRMTR